MFKWFHICLFPSFSFWFIYSLTQRQELCYVETLCGLTVQQGRQTSKCIFMSPCAALALKPETAFPFLSYPVPTPLSPTHGIDHLLHHQAALSQDPLSRTPASSKGWSSEALLGSSQSPSQELRILPPPQQAQLTPVLSSGLYPNITLFQLLPNPSLILPLFAHQLWATQLPSLRAVLGIWVQSFSPSSLKLSLPLHNACFKVCQPISGQSLFKMSHPSWVCQSPCTVMILVNTSYGRETSLGALWKGGVRSCSCQGWSKHWASCTYNGAISRFHPVDKKKTSGMRSDVLTHSLTPQHISQMLCAHFKGKYKIVDLIKCMQCLWKRQKWNLVFLNLLF